MRAVRLIIRSRRHQFDGVRAEHRQIANILIPGRDIPGIVGIRFGPITELMSTDCDLGRRGYVEAIR